MESSTLTSIIEKTPTDAWDAILKTLWDIVSEPVRKDLAEAKVTERDKLVGEIDNVLTGTAWELWSEIESSSLKVSKMLQEFWKETDYKAVLILDALSLREVPWILEEAQKRDFKIQKGKAAFSEIPSDTTSFAKAIGFGQRSLLENNGGASEFFPGAWTESTDMPFVDCLDLIKAEPSIFFWHHWPDISVHLEADSGNGARNVTKNAAEVLTSDGFWQFIDKLCTGRRLVITSDHGYADSGLFHLLHDSHQSEFMKSLFRSGRATSEKELNEHCWVPPLTLQQNGYSLALGRRKWKSQGGYPTLVHGGLSLLEVTVPYIEMSK